MDASQYKDYVLVLLFVKYVSDKYAGQFCAPIIVPPDGSFAAMAALKGDKEIGDKINQIIGRLAKENDLEGVIDVADFDAPEKLGRGKEMVDRLSNLVAIFENPALDFSKNRAEGDDILGDAYEYLVRHFATQSGKSKGQFYTPAEVSLVMARIIGIRAAESQEQTLYDPTCGSGSLLLKAAAEAPVGITIYGQEMDNATAALARMNMILHDNAGAEIWQGNSLARPHWVDGNRLTIFDFVVANPPFSTKAWRTGFDPENDLYGRFPYGIPPRKNGDYAFLLHILRSLKSTGKGAVILPHGVLFRGNVEAKIRKGIVRRGYIKGIIGLPANLFYGASITACILVLDKEHAATRSDIFMIDASRGFVKDGNKNRLRHQDIRKIVDVFNGRIELPKYSRVVSQAEIEDNDYNLNLPRYIDSAKAKDLQDIAAHLRGGIPRHDVDGLARYWNAFPTLKDDLFEDNAHPGYSNLRVAAAEIEPTILAHPEFVAYTQAIDAIFAQWRDRNRTALTGIAANDRPQSLIQSLSEDLLRTFSVETQVETQDFASLQNFASLLDKYDVYQHLMTYWTDTMQDDVYMIVADGWLEAARLRLLKARARKPADLKIGNLKYKADLIPSSLIVERYFAAEVETQNLASLLDAQIVQKYATLTEDEIKTLVVDDKWLAALTAAVQVQTQNIASLLAGRIEALAERYAAPLSQIAGEVDALNDKVEAHLERMGFVWK